MRYVIVLLVGIAIGATLAMVTLNALQRASAVPHGVMAVMQYHVNAVRSDVSAEQCTNAGPHFATLRALADDIAPVFVPTGGDDALFTRYGEQLRDRLDAVIATPATDCRSLTEQLGEVGDGCKACHRDFKS